MTDAKTPSHIEQTPAGVIDWKMEALRSARLLADAQRIIAEYKAQAIEAARETRTGAYLLQTAKAHGWLDDGEGALEFMLRRCREAARRDDGARARFLADRADTERKQASNPSSDRTTPRDPS